ncbi:TPA: glycosyltransferase family 2 protein, partial [Escherichia coli]|nr:glycosyltransferase family 2 protein [Escherichia coli]
MGNETVSIIMPAYNAEETIKDSILSILKQTYEDFKLYIIN